MNCEICHEWGCDVINHVDFPLVAFTSAGIIKDGEVTEHYFAICPACGDPIDYCQGHGEIGDYLNWLTLTAHDDGWHEWCHPDSECRN